ncbi:hypothetical protein V7O66_02345 [Methanolobus sp. ZRKC3]|uniref:hypothetical protein n=1 Tax=Methanolobus sp. ZRKC3 TaxID=3125786 RepID=UPI0032543B23
MILCECGEFIKKSTFKDYISTSQNPSTRTIGHEKCGLIFNFVDDNVSKKYSSRKRLKILAMKFAEKNDMERELIGKFLLEIDRLKSCGNMSDQKIILEAYRRVWIS